MKSNTILAIMLIISINAGLYFYTQSKKYYSDSIFYHKLYNDTLDVLGRYKEKLNTCNTEKQLAENNLTICKQNYDDLRIKYLRAKNEMRKMIKKAIPIDELERFLKRDSTDTYRYNDPYFICTDYSELLIRRLADEGYFACETSLYFGDTAHSIVAIKVVDVWGDEKIVYVEPQDDAIIYSLHVGDDYCEVVGWDCRGAIIRKITNCFEDCVWENGQEHCQRF